MFENSHRRHPVQTFQFWFVVLTSFVVVTAWKLDFFSFPRAPLPVIVDEPMPPPPQEELATTDPAPVQREAEIASEIPALEAVPRELAAAPESAPVQAESPSCESAPAVVRTAGMVSSETTSAVVQASAESHDLQDRPALLRKPIEEINLDAVDQLIHSGDDVAALRMLSGWYWKVPAARSRCIDRLNLLSRRIFFQPDTHYMQPHSVQFGDTPGSVAARYGLTEEYLMKLNRLTSPTLKVGQVLKVIQGPFSVIVDVSDCEMTIHSQGYFIARFKVGFGADASIPEGTFQVTEKRTDPQYPGPAGLIPSHDPANPIGPRLLVINDVQKSLPMFGVHGTSEPGLIGQVAGSGWIRLNQREADAIYDLLTIGSELIIQP
ncbi:LysM peptidoglycan-binding domain-containing protein [Planctomicrobium sp. SH661]|uniref:LysM peptidoglycan-binding domain-containing protein n=1 Tax=Planctomicrobium sp. SH661 TaxID=3448124 RepID=UPI003F5C848C